jgi:hypothetical protein
LKKRLWRRPSALPSLNRFRGKSRGAIVRPRCGSDARGRGGRQLRAIGHWHRWWDMRFSEPDRGDFRIRFIRLDCRSGGGRPPLSILVNKHTKCAEHHQQQEDYNFGGEGGCIVHGYCLYDVPARDKFRDFGSSDSLEAQCGYRQTQSPAFKSTRSARRSFHSVLPPSSVSFNPTE